MSNDFLRRIENLSPERRAVLAKWLGDPGQGVHAAGESSDPAGDAQQRLVAYVVPETPHRPFDDAELREFLQSKLPDFMVPDVILTMDALPRSPNGKLSLADLPSSVTTASSAACEFADPTTDSDRKLAAIWCGLLGTDRIGTQDNFFEVGGDSLLANQVVARICDAFSVDLPLQHFVEAPTIAALVRRIESLQQPELEASPRAEERPRTEEPRLERVALQANGTKPPLVILPSMSTLR